MFLLVADVLQQMIKRSVLQVRAEVQDIRRSRKTLDNFALAIGLRINFNKSTLVPNTRRGHKIKQDCSHTTVSTSIFPQVYLGLPLSNILSAFAPLCKVDRRLSTWQSALLNHQGRLTLVNSRSMAWSITSGPCLVHSENQKIFKILRHIESCGTCMKH